MNSIKNSHFLDWSLILEQDKSTISQEYNDSIFGTTKGVRFENLIEDLLSFMYPTEVWRRTAKTHDGKKDFVYPADESLPDQKWAECKNHQNNVSIDVLAPTLVMGAIENIDTILFFSYSQLNDNAVEGIIRYSESTKKNVRVFDGILLESLICEYSKFAQINRYFPCADFEHARESIMERPVRVIKSVRDCNGNRVPRPHSFDLGEPFSINIIVQNQSLEQIDYSIQWSNSVSLLVNAETNCLYNELACGSINMQTFSCQTIQQGKTKASFQFKINGYHQKSIDKYALTQTINVTETPHLFWSGATALDAHREAVAHLSDYCALPLFITAQSGMGKSTLIRILLSETEVRRKYSILTLDLTLSRNVCVKNLISQVIGAYESEKVDSEQTDEAKTALEFLTNNYLENSENLASLILKLYDVKRPFLIVVDDIQNIGRIYVDLLNELDIQSRKADHPIYYLFALNESNSSLERILSKLNWDAAYQNRGCKELKLSEFSHEDIVAFIQHRFGLTNISRFFRDFSETVRPIEVQAFCTAIKNKTIIAPLGVFSANNRIYQIVNEFEFEKAINSFLHKRQSLRLIISEAKEDDVSEYLLKYLYIADEITPRLQTRYYAEIARLISHGVIKKTNGMISFQHEEVRKMVGEMLSFSDEDYVDIYSESNSVSKAICALNRIDKLKNGANYLERFFQEYPNFDKTYSQIDVCNLIFSHIDDLSKHKLVSPALKFIRHSFELLDRDQGYIESLALLKNAAIAAQSGVWDIDEESVEMMAFLYKKFFDRSITTRNYNECTKLYPTYEKLLQHAHNISESRRNYWLAHYMNRQAIICDRESSPLLDGTDESEWFYIQSRFYCEKAGSPPELLLQLCVDEFNRHYVYRHNLTDDIIMNTYEELNRLKEKGLLNSPSLIYHLLLLKYLGTKTSETGKGLIMLLDEVSEAQNNLQSSFYTIKLCLLESYISIEMNQLARALEALVSARELAYKRQMRFFMYKITYIGAWIKVFEANGTITSDANKSFALAFAQLIDTHGNSHNSIARESYLINQLMSAMNPHDFKQLLSMTTQNNDSIQKLLQRTQNNDAYADSSETPIMQMRSYFIIRDVDFPII